MATVWTSDTWTANQVITPLKQAASAGKLMAKALGAAIDGANAMPYGDASATVAILERMVAIIADAVADVEQLAATAKGA